MKKIFEGAVHGEIPDRFALNKWLDGERLRLLAASRDAPFYAVTHRDWVCVEYKIRLNIFAFGRFRLHVPVTIIGPPVSVDSVGYIGDLNRLIADYKRRRGLFLILNLTALPELSEKAAMGETLSSCVFKNRFKTFEEYLAALRGGYRRRVKAALLKGHDLRVHKISNHDFTEEMHGLYLQVLERSRHRLETLGPEFFRRFDGEIFVFYAGAAPAAFVALKSFGRELYFVFGGLDYARRDVFDLYYNMLLFIVRRAIELKSERVNFGQTAERSKLRIGCTLEKRYLAAFSGNRLLNALLRLFSPALTYRAPKEICRCFKI